MNDNATDWRWALPAIIDASMHKSLAAISIRLLYWPMLFRSFAAIFREAETPPGEENR